MSDVLHFAPYRLEPLTQRFWRDDELVQLPAKTLAVLQYLAENPHRLVTQEEIIEEVWEGAAVSEGLVRGYIRDLRKLLGDDAAFPRFVETVAGRGYRFVARVTRGSSAATHGTRTVTPAFVDERRVVGRDVELAQLDEWLKRAVEGARQTIFISGEPGIGKTTVVAWVLRRWSISETVRIASGQCVDQYGQGEPYLPVLDALGKLCRGTGGETIVDVIGRHAPTWLVQMPGLVGEGQQESLRRRVEGATQGRMLRELAEALDVLGRDRPLVLVLEDLQWSDPSTVDLISFLARREPSRLAVIGTYRSGEVLSSAHPLKRVVEELKAHGQCRDLALVTLSQSAVVEYLEGRFPGHAFPPQLAEAIYRSTEGNPLFMVALVEDLVTARSIGEVDGRWGLRVPLADVGRRAPESVHQLIDSMIERLGELERRVLEASSIAGTEFTTAVVAAALESSSDEVEECCEALTRRRQFLRRAGTESWPDGTLHSRYAVVHALYQQVALDRSPMARRQLWHVRIGERLESAYGATAATVAPELAVHFEHGGDRIRAARYHALAAEQAKQRFAHAEAYGHFTRGLEVLERMPESPDRDAVEFRLQTGLGPLLTATRGYASAEVEAVNLRAVALAKRQGIGLTASYFPVLYGIYLHSLTLAKFRLADEIAEQLEQIAIGNNDPGLLAQALAARSTTVLYFGELPRARALLEQTLATYDPERDRALAVINSNDPGVSATIQLALVEWAMGEPDRALVTARRALELAEAAANPFLLVTALTYLARVHRNRREPARVCEIADRACEIAAKNQFPFWHGEATVFRGWALAVDGDRAGLAIMEEGLSERFATAPIGKTTLLMVAADAYLACRELDRGLRVVDDALAFAGATEEDAWKGETLRLQAELLILDAGRRPDRRAESLASARAAVEEALAIARRQSAKLTELRAAMTLCRVEDASHDRSSALSLLREICASVTEGHDLADLVEAKAMIASRD